MVYLFMDCKKRQKETGKSGEQYRCLEKSLDTYLQIVEEPTCTACPFSKPKEKKCWQNELLSAVRVDEEEDVEEGFEQPCRYRFNGKCTITGHKINPEICKACDQETADHMADWGDKAKNYANAIRRWIREGRPVRTKEEVAERLEICCGNLEKGIPQCKLYNPETKACKKCGCAVNNSEFPLGNKIKMKTEVCPLNLWK